MPVCFISKSEVKSWPVIGRLAALAGTLFVDRNGKNLYAVQSAIKASFASYNSVVFFPEGTTGAGDCVYPFKATLFRTAVVEGLPVQPLSIAYGPTRAQRRQAAYIDDDNFVKHLWSLLKSPPIQAQLEVLEPIFASFDPDVTTDPEAGLFTRPSRQTVAMARAMADRARQVIVAAQSDVANGRYAEAPTGGHRLLGHVHH